MSEAQKVQARTEAVGKADDAPQQTSDPEAMEAEAKQQGWTDRETYVANGGNPANWRSAEEFLKVGEEIDQRKVNRALREKVSKLEKVAADFKPFMDKALDAQRKRHEREITELKEKQDAAVESGDRKAYREATDALEDAKKAEQVSASQNSQPQYSPVAQAWIERNADWWEPNAEARAFADGLAPQLRHEMPTADEATFLAELESRVLRHFPRQQTRQTRQSEVDTGQRGGSSAAKSYDKLPPEAKAACDRFVSEIPGFTREDYVKSYEWEG